MAQEQYIHALLFIYKLVFHKYIFTSLYSKNQVLPDQATHQLHKPPQCLVSIQLDHAVIIKNMCMSLMPGKKIPLQVKTEILCPEKRKSKSSLKHGQSGHKTIKFEYIFRLEKSIFMKLIIFLTELC